MNKGDYHNKQTESLFNIAPLRIEKTFKGKYLLLKGASSLLLKEPFVILKNISSILYYLP